MTSGKSRNNKLYGWVRRKHAVEIGNLHRGKIESTETRQKKSAAHRGKKKSEEAISNMRMAQQNRSPEVCKNMSEAKIGHPVSEETREKLRQYNLGKKHTEETREKMSESRKGTNNHFFGKEHTPETKEKMKAARAMQVISEESKIKRSLKMKEYWAQRKDQNVV